MGASLSTLEQQRIDTILALPLEEQASYQDVVTYKRLEAGYCWRKELGVGDPNYNPHYECWNGTSIGGLASIALHCKDEEVAARAKELLAGFVQWWSEQSSK